MIEIKAKSGEILYIGRQGENDARKVIFDISEYRKAFGDGTVQLLAQRAKDATPYPCVVVQDGDKVEWTLSNADTAHVGNGSCELHYFVDETLCKSEVWQTIVKVALVGGSDTPPEPYEDWVDEVLSAGTAAQVSAEAAARSEENADRSARAAAQDADDASTYAGNASNAADDARGYSDNALSYAGAAERSAENAAESERNASASAINAAASERNAGTSEINAGTSEINASASERNAQGYADDAQGYASAAHQSAEDAGDAKDAAITARQGAETAQAAIENMTVSAEAATGNTPSVEKTTVGGVVNLKFKLVRGQDGADGQDGTDGTDGASAYEQAVDGGYTGTEAEFETSLAGLTATEAAVRKLAWEKINEVTSENSASELSISTDLNGNPFELVEALIRVTNPATAQGTGSEIFSLSGSTALVFTRAQQANANYSYLFAFGVSPVTWFMAGGADTWDAGVNVGSNSNSVFGLCRSMLTSISSLSIRLGSSNLWQDGTKLELWGKRK